MAFTPKDDDNEPGPSKSVYILPSQPGIIYVTREMAGDWLDNRTRPGTAHQRRPSPNKVQQYAEAMKAGKWLLTPQGLIFDTDGWLFNGQHRLRALRDSGLDGLHFWVFPNEASDLFAVVDTGLTRQAHQLYNGAYAMQVTGAVRYLQPGKLGQYARQMSPDQVLQAVNDWPEVTWHAAAAMNLQGKNRVPASPHLAMLAMAERTENREMIQDWLASLAYGANLEPGDARLLVRDRFLQLGDVRKTADMKFNLLAKAWNLYTQGTRKQVLAWREVEGTIKINGFVED